MHAVLWGAISVHLLGRARALTKVKGMTNIGVLRTSRASRKVPNAQPEDVETKTKVMPEMVPNRHYHDLKIRMLQVGIRT